MARRARVEDFEDDLDEPRSFDEIAEALPPREDEGDELLPEVRGGAGRSLSESIADVADLSDMQTVFLAMFPKDLGGAVSNKVMMARVAPDALLEMIGMGVDNEVMTSDPEGDINVDEIITRWYILTTIGLDGKGRIDAAELAGAAREQKLEKEKLKDLI